MKITKNEDGAKQACLPDGRWISVHYDKNGEINDICISYDSTPDHLINGSAFNFEEVKYRKDKAWYNIDHSNNTSEGSITSGYNFEKLKKIAESIFGENA